MNKGGVKKIVNFKLLNMNSQPADPMQAHSASMTTNQEEQQVDLSPAITSHSSTTLILPLSSRQSSEVMPKDESADSTEFNGPTRQNSNLQLAAPAFPAKLVTPKPKRPPTFAPYTSPFALLGLQPLSPLNSNAEFMPGERSVPRFSQPKPSLHKQIGFSLCSTFSPFVRKNPVEQARPPPTFSEAVEAHASS